MLEDLKEAWKYRELAINFVLRDIKGRYKQTFLGIAWAVIQPLFLMFVFQVIFSRFLRVDSGGVPYAIFSYTALMPWVFISKSLKSGGDSLLAFKSIITKVYFPREIVPVSSVLSNLVDFFISSLVYVVMLFFFKVQITWHIVFVLLILPIQVLLALAFTLAISGLAILFRDLKYALPLFVQIWMYASPIIYGLRSIQSEYKWVFYFNPIVGILEGYRSVILFHEAPDWTYLGISFGFAVVFAIFGYWLFKKLEAFFVDIM